MSDDEFTTYRTQRYDPEVKYYDRRAVRNKRFYNGVSVYIIVASLAVTPSVSLPSLTQSHGATVASILSLTVALGTALLGHFSFHEDWLKARATWDQLKRELYWHDVSAGPYSDCDDRNRFFVERVEELIAQEGKEWLEASSRRRKPLGQPPSSSVSRDR
jgi:hypothetical protein